MAVNTLGFGTPVNPAQFVNPYLSFAQPQYGQPAPFSPIAPTSPLGAQPLQQIFHTLQIVPQQLQQIQQLLQVVPGQLVQLQQLIQHLPQQIQQLFASQSPGLTGYGLTSPWGITPQVFAQPPHVM